MNRSKIGPFMLQSYNGQMEDLARARPRLIKSLDLNQLRILADQLGPGTVMIGRPYHAGGGTEDFQRWHGGIVRTDPVGAAKIWWDELKLEILPFREYGFYLESFNEMSDYSLITQYGLFEAERQRILYNEGLKACIGNFAVGNPDISEFEGDPDRTDHWPAMYPALRACHKYHNILGLHEYGGLWMWMWYGDNQHQQVIDGHTLHFPPGYSEGWLVGRYRKLWRRHIGPHGWNNIRMVFTEAGLDRAGTYTTDVLTGGANAGPWKQLGDHWARLNNRPDRDQFYLEQLQWLDMQMQRDPYVVGATMFAWGTNDAVWGNWDIAHTLVGDALLQQMQNTPYPNNAAVVTPTRNLYLRSRPNGPVLATLSHSDLVYTLNTQGAWVEVKTESGLEGFVLGKWLAIP